MSLVVSTQPSSLVAVDDQCARVEAWAETVTSIPDLQDANNKLGAIDEYLSLTASEGRARVAAARRRLEVRIGSLLGPAEHGGDRRSDQVRRDELDPAPLSPQQRSEFRKMAADSGTVEDVIAGSSDEAPASRSKVLDSIKTKTTPPAPKPRRWALPEQADKAGWEFRKAVERLERIAADDRFPANREQVAAALRGHLTYATEVLADLLRGLDTDPTEDR